MLKLTNYQLGILCTAVHGGACAVTNDEPRELKPLYRAGLIDYNDDKKVWVATPVGEEKYMMTVNVVADK